MKLGNVVIIILLVVLCVLGWFLHFDRVEKSEALFDESLSSAREWEKGGLYQKAIESYRQALSVRNDPEIRSEMMQCMYLSTLEGTTSPKDYKNALKETCSQEPQNTQYWERLIGFCLETGDYRSAHSSLRDAARSGADSQELDSLRLLVDYSYSSSGYRYSVFYISPEGKISARRNNGWGCLDAAGQTMTEFDYTYISPIGESGTAVFVREDVRLIDEKGVAQAILAQGIDQARAWYDGLVPVKQGGAWRIWDTEKNTCIGSFEELSSFSGGLAAARSGGQWYLVDREGNQAGEQGFEDVRLHSGGEYCVDKVMIARRNGAWGMYDGNGSAINEFSARDMDVYMGDYVAFQAENGLWGYADLKGNVVIEPAYREARSFSGGLAAVSDGTAWGFINRDNELAIDYCFKKVGSFTREGVCLVDEDGKGYHTIALRFKVQ